MHVEIVKNGCMWAPKGAVAEVYAKINPLSIIDENKWYIVPRQDGYDTDESSRSHSETVSYLRPGLDYDNLFLSSGALKRQYTWISSKYVKEINNYATNQEAKLLLSEDF